MDTYKNCALSQLEVEEKQSNYWNTIGNFDFTPYKGKYCWFWSEADKIPRLRKLITLNKGRGSFRCFIVEAGHDKQDIETYIYCKTQTKIKG